MTGKEIYSRIRICGYMRIEMKYYRAWLRSDRNLLGFIATVASKEKNAKLIILKRIQEWCNERKIPVQIIDEPIMKYRFKIKIIK